MFVVQDHNLIIAFLLNVLLLCCNNFELKITFNTLSCPGWDCIFALSDQNGDLVGQLGLKLVEPGKFPGQSYM